MPPVRPKPPVRVSSTPTPSSLAEHESEVKAPAERKSGSYTLPPLALLDPAQAERKVDERELMDSAGNSRTSAASSRSRATWCRSCRAPW